MLPILGVGQTLPIHIEESHAGAFYHLVETLPLSEPHTLVLFDAHSDANAIANSDDIRAAIRRGPTREARAKMLDAWREQGRIQCFNWLEPLMPAPISEVIWVPAETLGEADRVRLETAAREFLDAHEEALPREAGSLGTRYRVMDRRTFETEAATWSESKSVVASVDLDYFAELPDAALPEALEKVLASVLRLRGLAGLTFAISSPYLRDPAQAERLTTLALSASWRVVNAEVRYEPFAKAGPDRSLMARLLERQGKRLPSMNLTLAGPELCTLLLEKWNPYGLRHGREQAQQLFQVWNRDPLLPHIEVDGALRRHDGTWEVEARSAARLQLKPEPVGARVRWWALCAKNKRYRLSVADFGFASDAPRWLWQERVPLLEGAAQGTLPFAALEPVLDAQLQCGTVEVFAEVIRDGEARRTQPVILCVRAASTAGFKAAWSEQFGLPYVFDARQLTRGSLTGPEARWGADCATFISHGLRAVGWRLPWGSPRDIEPFLQMGERLSSDRPNLLSFGSHLAAVWEDREPRSVLDDGDLCVHQLEGTPEVLSFAELRTGRPKPRLMQLREPEKPIRLIFTGDVMLGRRVATLIAQGENPLAGIADRLRSADLAIGNLECVLGNADDATPAGARIKLIAPPLAAAVLKDAGFDAMSVANNHTHDLGEPGYRSTCQQLRTHNIVPVASEPVYLDAQSKRICLVAWDDSLESDAGIVAQTISAVRHKTDILIVLPHWGREHTHAPTNRQRSLAAAWMEAGADLVVGAGPHAVQPLEHQHRGTVAFSLGNAVFDGPGPGPSWSHGALLEVTWDAQSLRMVKARLLNAGIDDEGRVELRTGESFTPSASAAN